MKTLTGFIVYLLFLTGASFYSLPVCAQARLNIVYIMSDDHAAEAIGAYHSRLEAIDPTPNMDKFARESEVFSQAYTTNPICTPARANIITGQYSNVNGVKILDDTLAPDKQYLPMEMKKLGYQTSIVGKWHLASEPAAFDYYEILDGQGTYFDPMFFQKGKGTHPDNKIYFKGYSTDIITDRALIWLKDRDKTKPFFFMLHYKAPHGDFQSPPRYADYLKDVTIPEPESMYDRIGFGSEATRGSNDSLERIIGSSVSSRNLYRNYVKQYRIDTVHNSFKEATHLAYQEYLKRYLRCVKGIDDNIQRVFDYLKQNGLWENTIVIYTSDQGFMLGEHDYIDKRWMYEPSMQIPFIIHCPKNASRKAVNDLVINQTDIAPTLIELAGGHKPGYMQGYSFASLFKTGKDPVLHHDVTYCRYWMHMEDHFNPSYFGIKDKNYKLIFYYGLPYDNTRIGRTTRVKNSPPIAQTPAAWEFYDLKNDPDERTNVYGRPAYRTVIEKMKKRLWAEREKIQDTDEKFPSIRSVIDINP